MCNSLRTTVLTENWQPTKKWKSTWALFHQKLWFVLLVGLEFFAKFLITFLGSLAYLHNYFKDLEQARFDGPAAGGDRLAENGPCNEQLETAVQDYYTESGSESGSDAEGDKYVRGRRFARGVDLKLVRKTKKTLSNLCKVILFPF